MPCLPAPDEESQADTLTRYCGYNADTMSWIEYHRISESHASDAEEHFRVCDPDKGRASYIQAARAEELALNELDNSKVRTYGITAVSTASLYFKAAYWSDANRIAVECLSTPGLEQSVERQLREIERITRGKMSIQTTSEESAGV